MPLYCHETASCHTEVMIVCLFTWCWLLTRKWLIHTCAVFKNYSGWVHIYICRADKEVDEWSIWNLVQEPVTREINTVAHPCHYSFLYSTFDIIGDSTCPYATETFGLNKISPAWSAEAVQLIMTERSAEIENVSWEKSNLDGRCCRGSWW